MRKNILYVSLAILGLGLTSCTKNAFTITEKNNLELEIDIPGGFEGNINTYGIEKFSTKNNVNYTFTINITSEMAYHKATKDGDKCRIAGIFWTGNYSLDSVNVYYNGNKLNRNSDNIYAAEMSFEVQNYEDSYLINFSSDLPIKYKDKDILKIEMKSVSNTKDNYFILVYAG